MPKANTGQHPSRNIRKPAAPSTSWHPIHCIVVWLTDHGFRDAHLLAEAHDFGHSPGPIVREPPGEHLILCDDVTHRGDRFRERRNEIFFMQMPNIDPVGLQAVEALIDASCHMTFPEARIER